MTDATRSEAQGPTEAQPSAEATAAFGEEVVLNAAVAFAGQVTTAAQQAAASTGDAVDPSLREAVFRQYLLETATLCLRRLEESYGSKAAAPPAEDLAELLRNGAAQAHQAMGQVEALGDLGLDILDRLLASARTSP
ncbi:MAG TPA: hypothetical protein VHS99_24090 [Chloroflexota bacterium]|jgi:hypothetical protein|nr:hypothetical protein [Chloroflexota bacterium]